MWGEILKKVLYVGYFEWCDRDRFATWGAYSSASDSLQDVIGTSLIASRLIRDHYHLRMISPVCYAFPNWDEVDDSDIQIDAFMSMMVLNKLFL